MKLYQPTYTRNGETKTTSKWWVDFTIHGRRHRVPTGYSSKSAATLEAAKIVERYELAHQKGLPPPKNSGPDVVSQLITDYDRHLERKNRNEKYRRDTIRGLRRLLEGVRDLNDVTPEFVNKRLDELAEGGMTGNSINLRRRYLSTFYNWNMQMGTALRNPVHGSTAHDGTVVNPKGTFTEEEVKSLIRKAPPRRALIYLLAVTTGLRRAEILRLRPEWFDLDAGLLLIPRGVTKNKKEAAFALLPSVVTRLRQEGPDGAAWFKHAPDNRLLAKDLKRCGIPLERDGMKRTFHSLRNTMVTLALKATKDLAQVSKYARHHNPALTTEVYAKYDLEDQRQLLKITFPAWAYAWRAPADSGPNSET